MASDDYLHTANLIISVAGAATADAVIPGAGSAMGGAFSIRELGKRLVGKTPPDLSAKTAAALKSALETPQQHLPNDAAILIPQMIERAQPSPQEVMSAQRDPDRLCSAMLEKLTDPEHKAPAIQDAFRRVMVPIFQSILDDPATSEALRPAFETAVAESLHHIGETVEKLTQAMLAKQEDHAAQLKLSEALVIALAYKYAEGNASDFDGALAGLERALEVAANERDRGKLPSNTDHAVDDIIAKIDAMNEAGEIEEASAALNAEYDAQKARAEEAAAALSRLNEKGIAQAILARSIPDAVHFTLESLPPGGDRFAALHETWIEWRNRGLEKGLNFDLEVSIDLARALHEMANTPDQRGVALNDLAISLNNRGERSSDPTLLNDAVTAFREALKEWTRDRVPLDWAMTQNNLGTALGALGRRAGNTELLNDAVTAYREALKEWTRDRVPLQWATTLNNLGTALGALGQRAGDTDLLSDAVNAFREALKERTRDRVPLDWATTQTNLGNALSALGQRAGETELLNDAVTAYREALKEWTRDRVPLQWATTQNNLGAALQTLGERSGETELLRDAVTAYREALKERTRDRVPLDWAMTQNNLGNALSTLGERAGEMQLLSDAVTAYREALKEWTRDRVPLDWAFTQDNLAILFLIQFGLDKNAAHLKTALDYVDLSLEVFSPEETPYGYDKASRLRDDILAQMQEINP